MSRHYVLVDFENVQPPSLGALKAGDCHVMVFAGQHQTKVDLGLAQALQPFGAHAQYIQIVGNGKDALDFHIAFYVGKLAAEHPGADFTIVSKDTGFDPLIKHLAAQGIACKRVATLPGASVKLPAAKVAKPAAPAKAAKAAKTAVKKAAKATKVVAPPRLEEVIGRLAGMKHARPRTVKTLHSWLGNFKPPFDAAQVDAMLKALEARGVLDIDGTKVTYAA